jgi:hypothetical protein
MIDKHAISYSIESYVTGQGKKGYYLLASDEEGVWYWATAYDEELDQARIAELRGPCSSKGEAIHAGEDWVERVTSD